MKTIYKYPLSFDTFDAIDLPANAEVVDFQFQADNPFIWCLHNTGIVIERRYFRVVGTGQQIPEDAKYIKSCHVSGYVWHLFEAKAKPV